MRAGGDNELERTFLPVRTHLSPAPQALFSPLERTLVSSCKVFCSISLYLVDVDNNISYHNVKLVQPADLPEDYLPAADSFYAFEPMPAEDADELMTYELTIPYKERSRFEDFLQKIGFPVSALKKVVSKAAVF